LKHSYLTAGITLGNLNRLLRRNRIAFRPKYIVRILFLYQSAVWSSLFAFFDKTRFGKKLENTPVPDNPIFIIGHWRTGSTFLHQLMALDGQLKAPTLFEVAIPEGFLSSHLYYKPVMNSLLTKYRPMDKVRIGMDEPQEDEYAIYRLTDLSPLEGLVFPASQGYFLKNYPSFVPDGEKGEKWEQEVLEFYRKLYLKSGKIIISKNPFNSMRINTLSRIFPKARFIHIVRHPYDVVPSTINMWSILHKQNCLNDLGGNPGTKDVTEILWTLLTTIRKELPVAGQSIEVKYEDLIADPITVLKKIYAETGLNYTSLFEERLQAYLEDNEDFEKNAFSLSTEEKEQIASKLKDHMDFYGYQP